MHELQSLRDDIRQASAITTHLIDTALAKIPQSTHPEVWSTVAVAQSLHIMQACTNRIHALAAQTREE